MNSKKTRSVLIGMLVTVSLTFPMGAMAAQKLIVKDSGGSNDKFSVSDSGFVGINLGTGVEPVPAIHVKIDQAPVGFVQGVTNTFKIEGNHNTLGSGFVAYNTTPGVPPVAGERLGFIFMGSGYDGNNRNAAGFATFADDVWSPTSTPASFAFQTTPIGSLSRAERMRITGNGNIGIGTATPAQKVEINGGLRLNTATTQPVTCDATISGTIWFASGASTDTLQVCAKSGGTYAWKSVTLN